MAFGQAGSYTVCPDIDPAEVCGCTSNCNPTLCSPNGTGNCATASPGSMSISVPAGQQVAVDVTTPTCSSTSGLDTGESYTIGSTTNTSTGRNATPPFDGCLATGATASAFTISVNSVRKDECIDVVVTFTAHGGTPDPSCELLSALPVELIAFNAAERDEQIHLSWTTASEIDNDFFQVEHSVDGTHFETIDKITGAGTTSEVNIYTFIHKKPSNSVNYYRLKQVDFDGAFEYSNVVSVFFKGDNEWFLRPTLTGDQITIQWSENIQPEAISIFSLTGKMIFDKKINTENSVEEIDVQHLPKGQYFLKLKSGRSISTKRFIKI